MRILILIIMMFIYIGCSTKQSTDILSLKIQQKEIPTINIAKSGKFLFYAYLENGNKLTRISKKQLKVIGDEEIIQVYTNGYYPNYNILPKERGCGHNLEGKAFEENSVLFCQSNYTESSRLVREIFANTVVGFFSGGMSLIGLGYIHFLSFSPKKFKTAILQSGLNNFKNKLNINNNDLLVVHKVENIEQKIELSRVNHLNTSGIILMDNDNNMLGVVKFNDLKQKNIFDATAILSQRLANIYLSPKSQKNIKILIPPKIPKPILPDVPKLIKGEFETKAMFNNRVRQAMLQREEQIRKLQLDFRQKVEERNQKVEELKRLHQNDLNQIEAEQKAKKENIQKYMPYFTSIAMRYLVGNLALKNLRYDAENQLMYADLYGSNQNYHKKVYLKVPLDKARAFKSKKYYSPIVTYKYSQNKLTLNEIKVDNYYAKLAQTDYKPQKIEVKLKDKKIDTHYAQNDLSLQNPNLKDKYTVIGLSYTEDADRMIANFQDDLPNLISKTIKVPKDSTKWLFVIGVEKYDNTDNVPFSKRSAETFVKVAQKSLGVTKRNSYTLIGDQATSGAIEDKLRLMLRNIKEGDSIYFFYSGHGIPVLPNRIPYMLPKDKIPDYIGKSPFFKLTNIYNLLSNSKASKIIAIMDSCFSGSTDGVSVIKGVAGSVLVPKKVTFNHDKMVILTAGRDKQFSNMYPKKGHRLFSYFVMKSLLEGKRSVRDVYNNVYPKVKSTSNGFGDLKRQEPTIEGNEGLRF